MRTGAYLYPWDVDGDPAAADRLAGLGLAGVTLAAAYHAVRAVTPHHPGHRIVTRDAGIYFQPDPARWRDARLRPVAAAPGDDGPGTFERAAAAMRAAGLPVTAWVVVTHNSRLAGAGECSVRNAFGDVYPWALCAGSDAVREYAALLAAEAAALPGVDAIELEACGWYGFEHGSAHDKTGAASAGGARDWLLSLCFCGACAVGVPGGGGRPGRAGRPGPRGRRRRSRRCPATSARWSTRLVRPPPGGCSPGSSPRSARPRPASPCWCTPTLIRAPSARTPATTRPSCAARAAPTASC